MSYEKKKNIPKNHAKDPYVLLLCRPLIVRLVRSLVLRLPLSVDRLLELRRVSLKVFGGEGAFCKLSGCVPRDGGLPRSVGVGFAGGGGLHRSTVAAFGFREGESLLSSPSPALVHGGRKLTKFRTAV
ncbi:Uncharacterized protein Rs2_24640 [Raphanus sativus]|nr:Uncharacterized protein Rs2_24640 [Raphanus sativus]